MGSPHLESRVDYVSGTLGTGQHHPGLPLSPNCSRVIKRSLSCFEDGETCWAQRGAPSVGFRSKTLVAQLPLSLLWDWEDKVTLIQKHEAGSFWRVLLLEGG